MEGMGMIAEMSYFGYKFAMFMAILRSVQGLIGLAVGPVEDPDE